MRIIMRTTAKHLPAKYLLSLWANSILNKDNLNVRDVSATDGKKDTVKVTLTNDSFCDFKDDDIVELDIPVIYTLSNNPDDAVDAMVNTINNQGGLLSFSCGTTVPAFDPENTDLGEDLLNLSIALAQEPTTRIQVLLTNAEGAYEDIYE